MALNGKYVLVRDEGYRKLLVAAGIPEDKINGWLEEEKTLEISINGKNISITRSTGEVTKLILNQETPETTPDGVVKNTTSFEGENLVVDTNFEGDTWKTIYSVKGSELTVTSSISSKPGVPEGRRIFKRA